MLNKTRLYIRIFGKFIFVILLIMVGIIVFYLWHDNIIMLITAGALIFIAIFFIVMALAG